MAEDIFIVAGRVRPLEPVRAASSNREIDPQVRLLTALERTLYVELYARGSAPPPPVAGHRRPRFHGGVLSRANSGRGAWQPGWTVERIEAEGLLRVQRDGLRRGSGPNRSAPGVVRSAKAWPAP